MGGVSSAGGRRVEHPDVVLLHLTDPRPLCQTAAAEKPWEQPCHVRFHAFLHTALPENFPGTFPRRVWRKPRWARTVPRRYARGRDDDARRTGTTSHGRD